MVADADESLVLAAPRPATIFEDATSTITGAVSPPAEVLHPLVNQVTRRQLPRRLPGRCGVASQRSTDVHDLRPARQARHLGRTLIHRRRRAGSVGVSVASEFPLRQDQADRGVRGTDIKAMFHDNTSAFNCRHVTGDPPSLSPHSYGTAIDINTVRDPYMDPSGRWYPRTKGASYRDRSHIRPGMLFSWSNVTQLRARGYQWGGNWSHKDYQHFDSY